MKSVSEKITINLEGDIKATVLAIPPTAKVVAMGAKIIDATDIEANLSPKPSTETLEIAKVIFSDYQNSVVLAQSISHVFHPDIVYPKEPVNFEPFYSNFLLVRVEDIINKITTADATYEIEVFADYQ